MKKAGDGMRTTICLCTLLLIGLASRDACPNTVPQRADVNVKPRKIHTFKGHSPIAKLCFTTDKKFVIATFRNDSLKILKLTPDSVFEHAFWTETSTVSWRLSCHPKDNSFAFQEHDGPNKTADHVVGFAKILPVGLLKLPMRLDHEAGIQTLAEPEFSFAPNGKWLAYSAVKTSQLEIWPYPITKLSSPLKLVGHKNTIDAIEISHDSSMIASTSFDQTMRVWQISNHRIPRVQVLALRDKQMGKVLDVAFSKEGRFVGTAYSVNGYYKYNVLVFDRKKDSISQCKIQSNVPDSTIRAGQFISDLNRFLIGDEKGNCCIWDLKKQKLIRAFNVGSRVCDIAKANDERLVAIGCWDGSIHFVKLEESND